MRIRKLELSSRTKLLVGEPIEPLLSGSFQIDANSGEVDITLSPEDCAEALSLLEPLILRKIGELFSA